MDCVGSAVFVTVPESVDLENLFTENESIIELLGYLVGLSITEVEAVSACEPEAVWLRPVAVRDEVAATDSELVSASVSEEESDGEARRWESDSVGSDDADLERITLVVPGPIVRESDPGDREKVLETLLVTLQDWMMEADADVDGVGLSDEVFRGTVGVAVRDFTSVAEELRDR